MPTSASKASADGIMLSGSAASAAESQQAFDLASRLVGDGTKVVNGITVRGRDQVMLKVTVAEVRRDVIKQLGIDLSRQLQLRHRRGELQYQQSVLRHRPATEQHRARTAPSRTSPQRCARWTAPA